MTELKSIFEVRYKNGKIQSHFPYTSRELAEKALNMLDIKRRDKIFLPYWEKFNIEGGITINLITPIYELPDIQIIKDDKFMKPSIRDLNKRVDISLKTMVYIMDNIPENQVISTDNEGEQLDIGINYKYNDYFSPFGEFYKFTYNFINILIKSHGDSKKYLDEAWREVKKYERCKGAIEIVEIELNQNIKYEEVIESE